MAKTARAHIDDDVFSVLLQSIADRGNQLMPRREQVSRGRIERLKRTYPRGSGLVDVGSIRRIALAQHSSVSDRERKLCQTPPPRLTDTDISPTTEHCVVARRALAARRSGRGDAGSAGYGRACWAVTGFTPIRGMCASPATVSNVVARH